MKQIITMPPNMINGSSKTKPINGSKQAFPLNSDEHHSHLSIESHSTCGFRIRQSATTLLHIYTTTKATTKEEMVSTFLASKAEHTQSGSRVTPITHHFLGNEGIPKDQPDNKRMFRDCQLKPDNLMPSYLRQFSPKHLPGLGTRILSCRGFPSQKIFPPNASFK
jgi:hypothetical protein